MSSGIKKNSLDVFIGHTQKIGAIALDIGSENEIAFTYEPEWINKGFAIHHTYRSMVILTHVMCVIIYKTYYPRAKVLMRL